MSDETELFSLNGAKNICVTRRNSSVSAVLFPNNNGSTKWNVSISGPKTLSDEAALFGLSVTKNAYDETKLLLFSLNGPKKVSDGVELFILSGPKKHVRDEADFFSEETELFCLSVGGVQASNAHTPPPPPPPPDRSEPRSLD